MNKFSSILFKFSKRFSGCPCHDKCSWGCPCGFFQCSPPTNCDILPENNEAFERCGIECILRADEIVAKCIASAEKEDICYKVCENYSLLYL